MHGTSQHAMQGFGRMSLSILTQYHLMKSWVLVH